MQNSFLTRQLTRTLRAIEPRSAGYFHVPRDESLMIMPTFAPQTNHIIRGGAS